jgi:hypothetical protein
MIVRRNLFLDLLDLSEMYLDFYLPTGHIGSHVQSKVTKRPITGSEPALSGSCLLSPLPWFASV